MYGLLMPIESILLAQFNGHFLLFVFQLPFWHVFKLTELQNQTEYKARLKQTFLHASIESPPSFLPSPLPCRRLLQRSGEEALGPGAPGYSDINDPNDLSWALGK